MGNTPLHDALWDCRLDDVRKLAATGVEVNRRDENEQTALHRTHSGIYAAAAKIILAAGADIEALDRWGRTPLMNALEYGHAEAARFLLANGADFRRTDGTGRNAFFSLAGSLAKYFLSGPIEVKICAGKAREITFRFRDGSWNQLQWETKEAQTEMADTVDDPGEQYRMIRDLLPERDKKDELMNMAREFLAAGVRTDAVDSEQGTTVLMRAADVNSPVEFLSLMVEHGADARARDGWGLTALHYAARKGHADIVEYLIRAGADVSARDDVGFTPLHEAAENGMIGAARVLLTAGADKKAGLPSDYEKYRQGSTPCDIARQKGGWEMAEILKADK